MSQRHDVMREFSEAFDRLTDGDSEVMELRAHRDPAAEWVEIATGYWIRSATGPACECEACDKRRQWRRAGVAE